MNLYEFIVKLCQVFINDKILVILAVTAITIMSLLWMPQKSETIVTAAFTGLFGIAVGVGLARRSTDINTKGGEGK